MRRSSNKPLTFVEMYHKRLQGARSTMSSSRIAYQDLEVMSLGKCREELVSFATSLEYDPAKSFGIMKSILKSLPAQMVEGFMSWLDSRQMDVLQLCIVFNRPEIIRVVLESENVFHEHYTPARNPYAHLAAVLGYKECLQALLTHRPSFYFRTSKPQHLINIHKDIRARLKLKDSPSSVHKSVQKMLKRVDDEGLIAEHCWDYMDQKVVDVDVLDEEISLQNKSNSMPPKKVLRSSFVTFDKPDTEKHQQKTVNNLPRKDQPIKPNINSCYQQQNKGKHTITVHLDCFQDEQEGVVKGAGPSVKVLRPDKGGTRESKLPFVEDVRSLNQRSRANAHHSSQTPPSGLNTKTKVSIQGTSTFQLSASKGDRTNSAVSQNRSLAAAKRTHRKSSSSNRLFKKIELGVKRIKKYKDFQVVIDSRTLKIRDDTSIRHMNKTPLSLAAEKGHVECVKYLLHNFVLKQYPMLTPQELLTLATKARSPEAIAILMDGKYSRGDYQSAILTALRDFYPACLTVLLSSDNKERVHMFDGENLFHILFSQSLNADVRYELMPEMTRTLINCKEEVNARGTGGSHPMYTLIACAFNIKAGKQCLYYLECLNILLAAKANPHHNELREENQLLPKSKLSISRHFYHSAIHCVFDNAHRSTNFFEKPYWSKIIMQKFIECIVVNDRTLRRVLNDVLFCYMGYVCQLGLDRRILRALFRYGANPDFKFENKYAVNKFFDEMLPFLSTFQVSTKVVAMLDALMMLCLSMSQTCLQEAFVIFLDEHLLRTPIQALPLTRRFCYQVNADVRSPRKLVKLTSDFIWIQIRRNNRNAKKLPIDNLYLYLIMPS